MQESNETQTHVLLPYPLMDFRVAVDANDSAVLLWTSRALCGCDSFSAHLRAPCFKCVMSVWRSNSSNPDVMLEPCPTC